MDHADTAGFLERLLGRRIDAEELITLSSAQRARLRSWLQARGEPITGLDLSHFSLATLGASAGASASVMTGARSIDGTAQSAAVASGVGIDIQHITEFSRDLPRDFKDSDQLRGIFTLRELSYCAASAVPSDTLVGLFAAKEAIRKTGVTHMRLPLNAIEVLPDENGRPSHADMHLSISHSGEYAIAVAVARADTTVPRAETAVVVPPLRAEVDVQPRAADRARFRGIVLRIYLAGLTAAVAWLLAQNLLRS